MTVKHRVQHETTGTQIEIVERPYRQHMANPAVEVTVWESLEESHTLVFEETDPAHRELAPAMPVVGTIPQAALDALERLGYETAA